VDDRGGLLARWHGHDRARRRGPVRDLGVVGHQLPVRPRGEAAGAGAILQPVDQPGHGDPVEEGATGEAAHDRPGGRAPREHAVALEHVGLGHEGLEVAQAPPAPGLLGARRGEVARVEVLAPRLGLVDDVEAGAAPAVAELDVVVAVLGPVLAEEQVVVDHRRPGHREVHRAVEPERDGLALAVGDAVVRERPEPLGERAGRHPGRLLDETDDGDRTHPPPVGVDVAAHEIGPDPHVVVEEDHEVAARGSHPPVAPSRREAVVAREVPERDPVVGADAGHHRPGVVGDVVADQDLEAVRGPVLVEQEHEGLLEHAAPRPGGDHDRDHRWRWCGPELDRFREADHRAPTGAGRAAASGRRFTDAKRAASWSGSRPNWSSV
jgi:hypothetical protein